MPSAEETESYRTTIGSRPATVGVPAVAVNAEERATGPVTVTVRQLGMLTESPPATIVVPAA